MTDPLYMHQKELVERDPPRWLVGTGCGTGKTRTVLSLCRGKGSVLVVAPKTQVLDRTWEREAEKMGEAFDMRVMSKEQFKKGAPPADVLVVDECHFAAGVQPHTRYVNKVEVPRTSQVFDAVKTWIAVNRPRAVYMASATAFPQPMALWAYGHLFGEDWDYFAFRRKFYVFVPKIGRGVWLPRRDKETEALLRALAGKLGTFGRLEDFFDVPAQVFKDVSVGDTPQMRRAAKELPLLYPDPLARVGKRHQLEQGSFEGAWLAENKAAEVEELAREFPKLLVFARYTAQVDALAAHLRRAFKRKDVLVLDGRTKDRRGLILAAEDPEREAVVVAQSQVSTGYELPSFRATVFASMSYSLVDYEQALGRTLRANALAKNVYVHLTAGEVDEAVLECVRAKKDFNEALFAQEETT